MCGPKTLTLLIRSQYANYTNSGLLNTNKPITYASLAWMCTFQVVEYAV